MLRNNGTRRGYARSASGYPPIVLRCSLVPPVPAKEHADKLSQMSSMQQENHVLVPNCGKRVADSDYGASCASVRCCTTKRLGGARRFFLRTRRDRLRLEEVADGQGSR